MTILRVEHGCLILHATNNVTKHKKLCKHFLLKPNNHPSKTKSSVAVGKYRLCIYLGVVDKKYLFYLLTANLSNDYELTHSFEKPLCY